MRSAYFDQCTTDTFVVALLVSGYKAQDVHAAGQVGGIEDDLVRPCRLYAIDERGYAATEEVVG